MPNRTLKESIRESEGIDMLTPEAELRKEGVKVEADAV
jgi:hypothetical protein